MSVWKGGLWRSQFGGGGGVVNEPPAGPIMVTAPAEVASGGTFGVSFAGATDPEGDPITYQVSDTGALAFAKTTGIAEGESVGVTAPGVIEDTGTTFTVHAVDNRGAKSAGKSGTVAVISNKAPTGPIAVSYAGNKESEATFQVSFSGATDPEGDPITYQVSETGGLSFSKATGIVADEQVDVTAPKTEGDLDVTYKVSAADSNGLESDKQSETITIAGAAAPSQHIIGVEMTATGGPGGTWGHINAAGDSIGDPGKSGFDAHPVWGGMQDVTVDGQKMVRVPKFYYKRGESAVGNPAWWISDQPAPGFTVMPAFELDGEEAPAFQYGKYQASETSGKLASLPGVQPLVDTSLTDFIAKADARNVDGVAGFRLHHYDMWLAIQWLYLIESASMDSQATTGQGRVSDSGAADVDAADVAQATFRGIVGLWGNVWQWLDGVRTNAGVIERRAYGTGGWHSTGESLPNGGSSQYPITFRLAGDEQFIADTFSTSNNNTATLPDYRRWRAGGQHYPRVGGHWGFGANAGLWIVGCNDPASYAYSGLGSRLARIML